MSTAPTVIEDEAAVSKDGATIKHALEEEASTSRSIDALYKRQGTFFALAFIPTMACFCCMFLIHISTFVLTKTWYKNSAALRLGYVDPLEHETKSTTSALNAHALLGCCVGLLAVIQVVTANIFRLQSLSKSTRTKVELIHRYCGRIMAFGWIATSVLGAIFPFVSKRWDQEHDGKYTFIRVYVYITSFLSLFIATVSNMVLGVRAARRKGDEMNGALYLFQHKAHMFFSFYWISSISFDQLLLSIVQWVVNDCFLDFMGLAICYSIGEFLQISALLFGIYFYENTTFQHRFVRVNLGFLIARLTLMLISLVFLVATDNTAFLEVEGSCFAEF